MQALTQKQIGALSEILRDTGQVFFASLIVGHLANGGRVNWAMVTLGLIFTLCSWYLGISILKEEL